MNIERKAELVKRLEGVRRTLGPLTRAQRETNADYNNAAIARELVNIVEVLTDLLKESS